MRGSNDFQIREFGKRILNTISKVHFAVRKDIAYIKQAKFKLCKIEIKLLLPGSGILISCLLGQLFEIELRIVLRMIYSSGNSNGCCSRYSSVGITHKTPRKDEGEKYGNSEQTYCIDFR